MSRTFIYHVTEGHVTNEEGTVIYDVASEDHSMFMTSLNDMEGLENRMRDEGLIPHDSRLVRSSDYRKQRTSDKSLSRHEAVVESIMGWMRDDYELVRSGTLPSGNDYYLMDNGTEPVIIIFDDASNAALFATQSNEGHLVLPLVTKGEVMGACFLRVLDYDKFEDSLLVAKERLGLLGEVKLERLNDNERGLSLLRISGKYSRPEGGTEKTGSFLSDHIFQHIFEGIDTGAHHAHSSEWRGLKRIDSGAALIMREVGRSSGVSFRDGYLTPEDMNEDSYYPVVLDGKIIGMVNPISMGKEAQNKMSSIFIKNEDDLTP